jgi:hypothetical protein
MPFIPILIRIHKRIFHLHNTLTIQSASHGERAAFPNKGGPAIEDVISVYLDSYTKQTCGRI